MTVPSRYYYKAVQIAAKSSEAGLGYLLPLLAQARYQDVESLARQILAGDADNYYANLRLAIALRYQGKYSEAEKVAQHMLAAYPSDTLFMLELGLLSVAQNKKAEAKRWFSEVAALDPENGTAVQQLRGL